MPRLRKDLQFGITTNDPMAAGDTTLSSPGITTLPVVAGGDELMVTIDPSSASKEIVRVTAHVSASPDATVVRGQLGTTPVAHPVGTPWVHSLYTTDVPVLCTAATRPTLGLTPGTVIYETDTKKLLTWDGAAWNLPRNVAGGFLGQFKQTASQVVANSAGTFSCATSVAYTSPTSDRWLEVTFQAMGISGTAAGDIADIWIQMDAADIGHTRGYVAAANSGSALFIGAIVNPPAGAHTYAIFASRPLGTGTVGFIASPAVPAVLTLKDVGGV